MPGSTEPEKDLRLVAVFCRSQTLADDLQGFIARIQAPVVTDAEVFATLGSPDGERGLIERLRDLSHEFTNLSATAGESHYGRRAQRFARSLDLVVEQLSEIHRTAGSRVAGYVRDRPPPPTRTQPSKPPPRSCRAPKRPQHSGSSPKPRSYEAPPRGAPAT